MGHAVLEAEDQSAAGDESAQADGAQEDRARAQGSHGDRRLHYRFVVFCVFSKIFDWKFERKLAFNLQNSIKKSLTFITNRVQKCIV